MPHFVCGAGSAAALEAMQELELETDVLKLRELQGDEQPDSERDRGGVLLRSGVARPRTSPHALRGLRGV